MQATRQDILSHLHRHAEATIAALAEVIKISRPGLRQHLGVLERDGLVTSRGLRGRAGRPALAYSLTQAGKALFPNRYDDLSLQLLSEIRALTGSQGMQSVLMRVAARSAEVYESRVRGRPLRERVAEATAIINERGSIADAEPGGTGDFLINQHTCPFPNVALLNSGVCALEVEFVRHLTGGDARLVRSLLRGDHACTYRVRESN